ncbi:GerAB/ArcD/ProY family transporter [Gottfriedia acidiceleris]|uniref:Spore germination protein n=1 Tax=Gottfriedia acidiceleris TaxID=371036 RepID=A0ABY4JKJ0_9BACI|nr:GerAB/ArcD/ProY family transporter [Gottfriedia acidiceleris]UPM53348.1 spore germination protein [Gottfriedia acidiceleris]
MINNKHLFYLIIFTQFGVAITSLPNVIYKKTGHDGWISTLIAGLIVQILIFLYYSLYKNFPNKSFTDYTKLITNPFIGTCINICYYIYFLYVVLLISLRFSDIITIWIFPKSPSWLILILFLFTAYFVAKEDIQTIARTYVLCTFIFLIFILFLLSSYKNVHIGRILPIGQNPIKSISSGAYSSFIQMLGFEIFLFLSPSFQNTKKKLFTLSLANFFTTIMYTFVIFTSFIRLSNKENSYIIDPILYIFKTYQSKMIDSLDTLFLSIWTIVICATVVNYIYIISEDVHKRLSLIVKSRKSIVLFLLFIIFAFYPFISLFVIKRETLTNFASYLDPIFIIIIPFLLFLIHKVRGLIN